MKQIPKKQFDKVLSLSREVWGNGNLDVLEERIDATRKISGVDWLAIIDFVDCIIRDNGLLPGADDEMLYLLLRVMGWEVAENVEEHPAN